MFRIGDFSRLCQISIRMLRFYDETDIIKPALIDPKTNYRYYDATQLELTTKINFLRKTGFSTTEIKMILQYYDHNDQLLKAIYQKQNELEVEMQIIQDKLEKLKEAVIILEGEERIVDYKIEVKEIPGQYMMCKRGIIPSYDKEHLLWIGLKSEIEALDLDINYSQKGATRAYFYDEGYNEKEVDVEICVPVEGSYLDTENITFRTVPMKKCVSVTYQGSYDNITKIHLLISNWIMDNNCQLDGPNFTIYHVSPGMVEDPHEYVTEVCFPIK